MYYCSKKENTVKIKTVVFLDDDTDTVQYRPSRSPSSSFYAPAVVPHHAHSSIIIMHHQYTVPPRIMYAYTHTDELLSMIARARSYVPRRTTSRDQKRPAARAACVHNGFSSLTAAPSLACNTNGCAPVRLPSPEAGCCSNAA